MTRKYKPHPKVANLQVTYEFLDKRAETSIKAGFGEQKWIQFSRRFLDAGFQVSLYEARQTVSKYITLQKDGYDYKVRFSNHAPIKTREANADCDFFVGRTNFATTTTAEAITAAFMFFNRLQQHDESGT